IRHLVLILVMSLLLYEDPPLKKISDLEVNRICGCGTVSSRRKCKEQEKKIERCPNTLEQVENRVSGAEDKEEKLDQA
uniref:Uncharacterized protein n=1 Tax=Castor canadensis TaxID=51338 RepID=A0A8C0WJA6_CASCN